MRVRVKVGSKVMDTEPEPVIFKRARCAAKTRNGDPCKNAVNVERDGVWMCTRHALENWSDEVRRNDG